MPFPLHAHLFIKSFAALIYYKKILWKKYLKIHGGKLWEFVLFCGFKW